MAGRLWLGVVGSACVLSLAAFGCANGTSGDTNGDVPEAGAPVDAGPLDAHAGDARMTAGDGAPGSNDSGSGVDSGGGEDSGAGGDGGPLLPAHQAHGLVSGGVVSKSTSFVMTHSLSQAPGGNNTQGSTSYRLHGGVVGATQ